MRTALPAIVSVLYLITAILWAKERNWANALVWGSYALANIGIIIGQSQGE